MAVEMKPGMWRTRDSRIAVIEYRSKFGDQEYPWQGFVTYDDHICSEEWGDSGKYLDEAEHQSDLVEFLSPDIEDPRTWTPPVELKEGLWEMSDGSVQWAKYYDDEWRFMTHSGLGWDYRSNGTPYSDHLPHAVRYLGPSPLKGPAKKNEE